MIYNIAYIGNNRDVSNLKEDTRINLIHSLNLNTILNSIFKKKEQYEVLLVDKEEVAKDELKFLKKIIHTPIFLIGHAFSMEEKRAALQLGITDCYTTPVDVDKFITRILFLKKTQIIKYHKANRTNNIPSRYKLLLSKRIFDIIIASSILIAISPLLLVISVLIRLESKGKIYYAAQRVGTGYKVFNFYKLRSMYPDADKRLSELKKNNQYIQTTNNEEKCSECEKLNGVPCSTLLFIDGREICERKYLAKKRLEDATAFVKIANDPRITKVGRFIRNTSIDELPQLINVLKGDMSIVGNRPLPLYEAELLTTDSWSQRFKAPSGITGLWQVNKRGKKGDMSPEERKELDNYYAQKSSLFYDIKILLKTVPALLQKENV